MSNTVIEINIAQFVQNLKAINQHIHSSHNKVKFCLPIKADAYGHGLVAMAVLAQPYIDYFGVACLEEGAQLRESGITKPILVFGAFSDDDIPGLVKHKLEITVSSKTKADLVASFCRETGQTCKVHIKVDTGMGRIGVRLENAADLINVVINKSELELVGVYSHLASSDELDRTFTIDQINKFTGLVKYVKAINPQIICHIASSGAVCYYLDSYFDMVRPGILSYGYFPLNKIDVGPLSVIKPCYSLKSKVVFFKTVDKNQSISYNRLYTTKEFTRVVTIPVGYGDGYRRILSNTGNVLIRGHKYTISGTICMDMFMVDIGSTGEAFVGDKVVLIGAQDNEEILINDLANKCQTNIYEILCGFTKRVPRTYI